MGSSWGAKGRGMRPPPFVPPHPPHPPYANGRWWSPMRRGDTGHPFLSTSGLGAARFNEARHGAAGNRRWGPWQQMPASGTARR